MPKQKQGFKGQRLITINPETISNNLHNPLVNNLYATKIGYFPNVKYHFVNKEKGVDYYMIIYCTTGNGWCKVAENIYSITSNQFIILPPNTKYSFGSNNEDPWSIYWIHFKGHLACYFSSNHSKPLNITQCEESRFQDRIQLFEEIYANLELNHHSNHYSYSSICLVHFLGSFKYIDQFRKLQNNTLVEKRFAEKVIYFMRENIEQNFTLMDLSKQFSLSTSHFSALFQKETHQSPIKYFIALKIEKACQYIELSNLKITEIYPKLGFQDAAYFSRMFTKIMGISPLQYRLKERNS